jgi:hypothetical protein
LLVSERDLLVQTIPVADAAVVISLELTQYAVVVLVEELDQPVDLGAGLLAEPTDSSECLARGRDPALK